ncbi:MAG TPA: hypothetical protein VK171_16370, partial [Fimbriimonas sp.]|nr:hypothetical protein [Fimbriimonas sp.]
PSMNAFQKKLKRGWTLFFNGQSGGMYRRWAFIGPARFWKNVAFTTKMNRPLKLVLQVFTGFALAMGALVVWALPQSKTSEQIQEVLANRWPPGTRIEEVEANLRSRKISYTKDWSYWGWSITVGGITWLNLFKEECDGEFGFGRTGKLESIGAQSVRVFEETRGAEVPLKRSREPF